VLEFNECDLPNGNLGNNWKIASITFRSWITKSDIISTAEPSEFSSGTALPFWQRHYELKLTLIRSRGFHFPKAGGHTPVRRIYHQRMEQRSRPFESVGSLSAISLFPRPIACWITSINPQGKRSRGRSVFGRSRSREIVERILRSAARSPVASHHCRRLLTLQCTSSVERGPLPPLIIKSTTSCDIHATLTRVINLTRPNSILRHSLLCLAVSPTRSAN
jgi:hypothetical protein